MDLRDVYVIGGIVTAFLVVTVNPTALVRSLEDEDRPQFPLAELYILAVFVVFWPLLFLMDLNDDDDDDEGTPT